MAIENPHMSFTEQSQVIDDLLPADLPLSANKAMTEKNGVRYLLISNDAMVTMLVADPTGSD